MDYYERDRNFFELGKEHGQTLIKFMIECLEMADKKTYTKEQVITILKGLME